MVVVEVVEVVIGVSHTNTEEDKPLYEVTIINLDEKSGSLSQMVKEGDISGVSAKVVLKDSILVGFSVDGEMHYASYWGDEPETTIITDGSSALENSISIAHFSRTITKDTVITCVYRPREYRTITAIDATPSTITIKEQDVATIRANNIGARKSFRMFSKVSGADYRSENGADNSIIIKVGRDDITMQATYNDVSYVTVNTNSGSETRRLVSNVDIWEINSEPYPNRKEFDAWSIASGNAIVKNKYSNFTYISGSTEDSVIDATYKNLPLREVVVENGYAKIDGAWVTSGFVLRGSDVPIKMKPAPLGHQFLQWEVLQGYEESVQHILAESTNLRNVTEDIVVRATYYIPDPNVKYTLTLTQKDGTIEAYNEPTGAKISISAQPADEGYRFYRWEGDIQYLTNGRYEEYNTVNMPARNITLQTSYVREDYVTKYHLYMYNAECLLYEDQTGEVWGTDGEFLSGTVVRIRSLEIPQGWKFNEWKGETNQQTSLVNDLYSEETFITISNIDVHMTATIIDESKYTMKINNGQTSGEYYGNSRVDVYFDKTSTPTLHNVFTRWTGPTVSSLELYDGGSFDVTNPGSANEPQYIKMPLERTEITAEYYETYKLEVNGGHIDGTQIEFFANGDVVSIVADPPDQDHIFCKWEGDTDNIGNVYDPTTTITITDSSKVINATYVDSSNNNYVGYGTINFEPDDIIDSSYITIIYGTLEVGFILTDAKGHVYVVTDINGNDVSIARLTSVLRGGDIDEE